MIRKITTIKFYKTALSCLDNCNGNGECQHDIGECICDEFHFGSTCGCKWT